MGSGHFWIWENELTEWLSQYSEITVVHLSIFQGVNVVLSNKNKNEDEYISMVPTSAMLGDGVGQCAVVLSKLWLATFSKRHPACAAQLICYFYIIDAELSN